MGKFLLSLGAASLALAPVAASAGTRVNDVVPSAAHVSHAVAKVDRVENMGGGGFTAVLAFWALIIAVILIDESDDSDSPG